MMSLQNLVATLQRVKGDGVWREAARRSQVHYDTLARIARGAIEDPSAKTVEKISAALVDMGVVQAKPRRSKATTGA